MSPVRVIPLVCPDCGNTVTGLRFDKVFFCMQCMQGLDPSSTGEWERREVYFPALSKDSMKPHFYLPFWQFAVRGTGTAVNKKQNMAVKKLEEIRSVWVAGFTAHKATYFGDLGLIFTQRAVELTPSYEKPHGAFIAGCTRGEEEAKVYVDLYTSLMADKRADITGMEIKVDITGSVLWAVPFILNADKLVDLVMGNELPSFAVDDLEDIKRVGRIRQK